MHAMRLVSMALFVLLLATASSKAFAQTAIPSPRPRDLILDTRLERNSTRYRDMAGAASSKGGFAPGLFLTEPGTGWVLYRPSAPVERDWIRFDEFQRTYEFQDPTGLAFADPRLYVYDAPTRTVSSLLLRGEKPKPEVELISRLPREPSHMAVSPHGLVAVIQNGEVFFLQKDSEPIPYPRTRFQDPIDLAFSSWNTLEVLDAARNTLVSITFRRLTSGALEFEDERSLPAPEEGAEHRWLGMSIFDGIVYLADESTVYAYLAADQQLVPVAIRTDAKDPIRKLALTGQSLHLLHAEGIRRYPRAQPVDLALEGGPAVSQRALFAFYRYLHENGLLLTRSVRVRMPDQRLDTFLFDNGVLVAPVSAPGERDSRALTKAQMAAAPSLEEQAFLGIFCSMNPLPACRTAGRSLSLRMIVPQNAEIRIPRVQLLRRLGKQEVELDGRTADEEVSWRVPSPELRAQALRIVRKLNPAVSEAEMAKRTKGTVTVPIELWTVTAAVPVPDYRDRSSPLWALARQYARTRVYGREGFTAQTSQSLTAPPPDGGSPDCQTLKAAYKSLLTTIDYPIRYRPRAGAAEGAGGEEEATLLYPPLHAEAPRVGILEFGTTVKTGHQVFGGDRAAPSWHQAVNLELIAEPKPSTYTNDRTTAGASLFSPEAHHGTHVAAIIGGRPMDCWSGLLPRARLVLVDLKDMGALQRAISNAVDVDVRVFNVSQSFEHAQMADTIRQFRDQALFVAAAGPPGGQPGRLLNIVEPENVPAPARWGQWANVITVTGTNAGGEVLTALNRGKRYVDLAAAGEKVYSASEAPGTYGPATGSSQAAPQVAAAAAMLVDPAGEAALTPGDAKARLIATAKWDWDNDFGGGLWGGRLDFAAAVRFPHRHILVTSTGAELDRLESILPKNDPTIRLSNAPTYFERESPGATAPDKIKFARILSLRKSPSGKFRVVLRDQQDQLKIILDAELASDEKIQCHSSARFNPERADFEANASVCASGIAIDQISEYYRGGAYKIQWPKPPKQ